MNQIESTAIKAKILITSIKVMKGICDKNLDEVNQAFSELIEFVNEFEEKGVQS